MRNGCLVAGLVLCQGSGVLGFGQTPDLSLRRSWTSPTTHSKTAIGPRIACTRRAPIKTITVSSSRVNMNNFLDRFLEGRETNDSGSSSAAAAVKQKCPVLICPAQLSVPADYGLMIAAFKDRGFPAYCADLTRLGWISGLLPSALSAEYFKGELVSSKTLQFYYQAIDRALDKVKENHPGQGLHVVGHSIGGWVARSWLAEHCSPPDRDNVLSLTTLGTPNRGPREDAGVWTAVDQTRGLLKSINSRFPGAHVDSVRYTSVAGGALEGKFPGSLEEMLAFVSYLPLCGNGRVRGDGIIPCDIATLDGSTMVELPTSKHSGFVPFPGKAVDLGEDFLWYGSSDLIGAWIGNLEEAERKRGISGTRGRGGWPW
ncbi:unnamed protein product [Ascophyllum nodosum]